MAVKVLIVDDEALARSRLRTLLGDCKEPATEVVGEAANAVQAMDLLQRMPCDLVLLAVHMPGVHRLRELEHVARALDVHLHLAVGVGAEVEFLEDDVGGAAVGRRVGCSHLC